MTQPYRDSSRGPHRLLVATDFDPASEAALERSAVLARDSSGSIHLLCVLEALMYTPPDMAALAARDPELHPETTRHMEEAVRRLHELGVATVTGGIEFGIAADVIVRYANSMKFDLLLLGSRGRGSTSAYVIPRVSIPVTVVSLRRDLRT
jgi:nucleotide-binding universal stress UspA family protein